MTQRITMADVARAAGVHQTTVSLALRNHRSIPPETRERIRTVATSMGYRPNPLVSALIAARRHGSGGSYSGTTLGFLTCFPKRDSWRLSPNYVAVFEELRAHAADHGYRIEEFWLAEPGMTPVRLKTILLNRGIRGLIICPMPNEPRVIQFDFSEFAAVALGLTLHQPALDRVSIDYYAVMNLCVTRLREKGRKRIAFATTFDIDSRVNHLSLGAFLAERHLEPRRFLQPLTSQRWNQENFMAWLVESRPDALITAISPDYLTFKSWIDATPARNRPAVELVCVDCTVNIPAQTGVVQNLGGEARAAIDLLTSRVERAQFGVPAEPQTILVTGTWREKPSPEKATRPPVTL
ncbi:MAG: LacI family DNA-binding transcriptional regulator [Rariglobus sp.]